MRLTEGGIYTNGKPIWRKILDISEDKVSYAKCYRTPKGIHVIGGGVYCIETILAKSFKQWAKQEVIV